MATQTELEVPMRLLYSFVLTLILFSVMTLTDASPGKDKVAVNQQPASIQTGLPVRD